jgi:hypothetical protein
MEDLVDDSFGGSFQIGVHGDGFLDRRVNAEMVTLTLTTPDGFRKAR